MKICHLSIVELQESDPSQWIDSIPYFTRVLEALSVEHEVISFHCSTVEQKFRRGNVVYSFSSVQKNLTEVDAVRPDIIIVHGWHRIFRLMTIAGRLKPYRIFIQHHGERVFSWPKSWLQKIVDRRISGYLFSSTQMGEAWVEAGQIAKQKIFEVMEVGSSFDDDLKSVRDENEDSFLWVGRLDPNKDPLTLVDSFILFCHEHPKARLRIVFKDDGLLDELKKRIVGYETNIELVGTVPHPEMKSLFKVSSFIVSTSHYEGSGIAVLEAISMGCIPILTAIPSFQKMTDNGRLGILFKASSVSELTNALRHSFALDRTHQRRELREHFKMNLSARAIAAQIVSIVSSSGLK